ncbi:hypothetical protein PTBPS01_28060 [Burkholderia pseudomallei]|nr:hypothetical protein PTBPS01_28060 [Burkholderia pseudomallei]
MRGTATARQGKARRARTRTRTRTQRFDAGFAHQDVGHVADARDVAVCDANRADHADHANREQC